MEKSVFIKYKILPALAICALISAFLIASYASIACSGICEASGSDFKSVGKSAYLVDVGTGTVLYSRKEDDRLPIASMVKIMTALLTMEEIDSGGISLDDDVRVSENSASMGGSQVFLEANTTHKLSNLLKSVIVASANDSCVALAEHISGSVEDFVERMNERARELGMQNTAFKNCTGLPAPESFSSAKDVSIMFRELIKHPIFFEYASVWLEDYVHPDGRVTSINNTNKLVRYYDGCDGGKTGFTSEAKFCLCATAKKGDMRVVAVVIGADSSKVRNGAVSSMFDYAFANYSNKIMLKEGDILDVKMPVTGSKTKQIALTADRNLTRFVSREDKDRYEIRYDLPQSVKAPIEVGDVVGKAYLVRNGEVVDSANVIANEGANRINLFDAIGDIARNWQTIKG